LGLKLAEVRFQSNVLDPIKRDLIPISVIAGVDPSPVYSVLTHHSFSCISAMSSFKLSSPPVFMVFRFWTSFANKYLNVSWAYCFGHVVKFSAENMYTEMLRGCR